MAYAIAGTDAAFFAINETSGALSLAQALDFETATSHNVTITATVGTLIKYPGLHAHRYQR